MPDASKPEPPDFERVRDAFSDLYDELRVVAVQSLAQPSVRQLFFAGLEFVTAIRRAAQYEEPVERKHMVNILRNASDHSGMIYEYIVWQRKPKDQRTKRPPSSPQQIERLAVTMRDSLGQLAELIEGDEYGADD